MSKSRSRESPIKDFYSGRGILVTGATGFVGKVLLEKLIRAFHDIGPIYVLLRQKKGLSAQERLEALLRSRTFSFHSYSESQLQKVVAISGDMSEANLAISEADRKLLVRDVSIVFHSAATIRFDVLLAEHIRTNVMGAVHIVELCKELRRLTCLVHVSTAFSNCNHEVIEERLYPLPIGPEDLIRLYKTLSPESLEKVAPDLLDGRPNTYVFSKAVAEHVIALGCQGMTVAVARPSIVAPAMKEPAVGWVDSVHGPAGLSVLAGVGILQTVDWDYNVHADVCPVDLLSNMLIGSAWTMATKCPSRLKFFNMSSTNMVPMSSGDFMAEARKANTRFPSIYNIRPPTHPPKRRPHPLVYRVQQFLYHVMFAYLIDFVLGLVGREKIMVRIVNKMHHAMDLMKFFALNEWKFKSDNFLQLIDDMSPSDDVEFDCDIRKFRSTGGDKLKAIEDTWLGCRRYILNEPDSNMEMAKKKYVVVCFFYRLYQIFQVYLAYKFFFVWTPCASYLYSSASFICSLKK